MNFLRNKGRNFVEEADRARDSQLWTQAADLYAKHLEISPSDVAILVQAGNCLKEARRYEEAAVHYRKALELDPGNSDTHLQYGHLMKSMGRHSDAIESYKRSVAKDPSNKDAVLELVAAGESNDIFASPTEVTEASVKTIWLDVTDLMQYAQVNKSLSGIQRVVGNLILHIESGAFKDYRAIPVVPEYDRHRILAVSPAALAFLVRQFDAPILDRNIIDKAIKAVYDSRYEVYPTQDDFFVVAGAFWIYPHYDVIAKLRQEGMRFCVFIHDLIQIRNPEYVQQEAVDKFQRQLVDVLSVCDFVLTNSHFVASEVEDYFKENLTFQLPVKCVSLATELRKSQIKSPTLDSRIREMAEEEYVLCVATIEVRKNHMYQIRIWERLVREFGDKVPKLVWVGKWGWQIDELRHHLSEHAYVGDWLFIFNDISDNELEYLYKNALFTCYTSFAEGFGLPIGESLNYGKPCVASNVTSMPEVGGRFVRYIDPRNVEEGYKLFRDIIGNRADLFEWEQDIRRNFVPKTWNQFCDELFSTTIEMGTALGEGPGALHCRLPANEIIEGGDDALLRAAREGNRIVNFRAARASGWFAMEHWGVWSSNRRSKLIFDSDLTEGEKVRIYLYVQCPPRSNDVTLIASAGADASTFSIFHRKSFVSFDGIVGLHGRVIINLQVKGKLEPADGRSLHLGLTNISYCKAADPLARIDLLEKVTLYHQIER